MYIKISQLPNIPGSLGKSDFIEVSHDLGNGVYTSSKAKVEDVAKYSYDYQGSQVGGIYGSGFYGIPLQHKVSLSSSYSNTSYIITITGEDARLWTVTEKTTSSFVVSSNSNVPFHGYVYWRTEEL